MWAWTKISCPTNVFQKNLDQNFLSHQCLPKKFASRSRPKSTKSKTRTPVITLTLPLFSSHPNSSSLLPLLSPVQPCSFSPLPSQSLGPPPPLDSPSTTHWWWTSCLSLTHPEAMPLPSPSLVPIAGTCLAGHDMPSLPSSMCARSGQGRACLGRHACSSSPVPTDLALSVHRVTGSSQTNPWVAKSSTGSGSGLKEFPYTIGEPHASSWGSWMHHHGSSKVLMLAPCPVPSPDLLDPHRACKPFDFELELAIR